MNTVTEIEIDTKDGTTIVEIKSKRDNTHASGWSVIAFTQATSIRCVKCHRDDCLRNFAESIIASCGGIYTEELVEEIEDRIIGIID